VLAIWFDSRQHCLHYLSTERMLTHRDAYAAWHLGFDKYKSYTKRAIAAWQTIEHWTKAHHPEIYQSLG